MHWLRRLAIVWIAAAPGVPAASAWPCTPGALGVGRTIAVNPNIMPVVGKQNYHVGLPLAAGEVVLTFDDGPNPGSTNAVLKALANQCTRATFFMVGNQANANPQTARQVYAAGHTIGTHSQTHPLHRMTPEEAIEEIDGGIASVSAALGSPRRVAPFFRFPGLFRTRQAELYLRQRGIMAWSVDVDSSDWKDNDTDEMLKSAVARLKARHGGILLMHDAKSRTAEALPKLLVMLKAQGFRIVHVVPSTHIRPDLIAAPQRRLPKVAARPFRVATLRPVQPAPQTRKLARAPANDRRGFPTRRSFDVIFTSGVGGQGR